MSDRTIRAVLTGSSTGAVKAFHEVEDAAKKSATNTSKPFQEAGTKIGGVFKNIIGGALSIGTAYVGFTGIKDLVGGSIKAFGDQQTATTLLNLALKDMGQKWTPALQTQLAKTSDAMLAFGDTNATTEGALQKLIVRGVPASQAMSDLSVIANIAAASHISLASATELVTKAVSGKMSPALKELGATTLPKGVTGVKALNDILSQVAPHVSGAAIAVSKTMPGALATLGATITEKVMVPLGAMINKGLIAISTWISAHSADISKVLGGAMTALGIAAKVAGTALGIVGDVLKTVAKNMDIFGPILAGVVGSFVTWKAVGMISAIITPLQVLGSGSMIAGLGAFATASWAAVGPWAALAVALGASIAYFGVLLTNKGKGSDVLDTSNAGRQSGPGSARFGAVMPPNPVKTPAKPHAAGGRFISPHYGMVGDVPEFVLNDPQMASLIRGVGGGATNVIINVNGGDPESVVNALRKYMQRNGTVPITVRRASTVGSG